MSDLSPPSHPNSRPETLAKGGNGSENVGNSVKRPSTDRRVEVWRSSRLYLPLLALPFVFGWLELRARQAGWFSEEAGVALLASGSAVAIAAVIAGAAAAMRKLEEERQQAEFALRKSRELVQSIADTAPAMIYVKDLAGRYQLANRRFNEVFCLDPGAVLGKSDHDIFPPETADAVRAMDLRLVECGAALTEEETAPQSDGLHSFLSVKAPLFDAGGAPYAVCGVSTDITERKRAEEALRAVDERARVIFEAALDAIITIDRDGIITGWNAQAQTTFGWTASEAIGRGFVETIIPEAQREAYRRALCDPLASDDRPALNSRHETHALHRDGREILAELAITPIRVGETVSFAAFARDITWQHRAAQALSESERRVRTVIDLVPHYIFAKDRDGRFLFVNRAFAESYGLTPEEIVGRMDREILLDPKQYEVFRRDDLEVIDSGTSKFIAAEWRTEFTGRLQIMQTTKIPFASPDTGRPAVLGISVEITAQKQAEEKMAWLASFPEVNPNPIVEIALSSGTIHYANPAAVALFPNIRGGTRHPFLSGVEMIAEAMIDGQTGVFRREVTVGDRSYSQTFHHLPEAERLRIYSIEITDRTRAESALERQRVELAFILDAVPALVFYKDAELRFLRVNDQLVRLAGRSREEMKGKTENELGWVRSEKYLEAERAVLAIGEARRGIVERFESTAGTRWYLVDLLPHRNLRGRVAGVIGLAIDITDRVRAEEELTASLREVVDLKTALDEHSIVAITDPQGRINYVNDKFCAISKYSREELLGQDHRLINSGYHSKAFMHDLWTTIGDGRVWRGEIRNRAKDGSFYWVDTTIVPFLDEHGKPRQYVAIRTDTTARKSAEEELLAAETKFRCLVEQSLVGIYVIQDERFVYVNPKMCEIHACSMEEMTNRPVNEFVHEEDRGIVSENIRKRLSGEVDSINYRVRAKRCDGKLIHIEVLGGRTEYNGKTAILGTLLDITERMRAEEEIRRLNAELELRVKERTAQLEAANRELEAFSYSVSHDLRAPLRAVDGFSQAVIEDYESLLPAEGQRYLRTIRESAQHMGQLIDDLLTFSRLSRMPLQRRTADFKSLVRDSLLELEFEQRDRPIELRVGELLPAEVDPALFKQVWINLLSNALKYTRGRSPAVIEVGCAKDADEVVYHVRDNGAGFDMRYASKLFGVFQRMHRAEDYEGTGVGLAIVARIVHRHGGRVWAEAEVDRGATFYFTVGKADA